MTEFLWAWYVHSFFSLVIILGSVIFYRSYRMVNEQVGSQLGVAKKVRV